MPPVNSKKVVQLRISSRGHSRIQAGWANTRKDALQAAFGVMATPVNRMPPKFVVRAAPKFPQCSTGDGFSESDQDLGIFRWTTIPLPGHRGRGPRIRQSSTELAVPTPSGRILLKVGDDSETQGERETVGLCATCQHLRFIVSDRGSTFYQCGRSASDANFPKYPRLPVLQCPGYEPKRESKI